MAQGPQLRARPPLRRQSDPRRRNGGMPPRPCRPLLSVEAREPATGLVVFLHGFGDSAYGMRGIAEAWAGKLPHVEFLLPTAPIYAGCRTSWFGVSGCGHPLGIERPWVEILELVEAFCSRRAIPTRRVVFIGFSQGAGMASWVALPLPRRCGGLVLLGGLAFEGTGISEEARTTPVLYCTGAGDNLVPPSETRRCRDQLRGLGFRVDYAEHPGQGPRAPARVEFKDTEGDLILFVPSIGGGVDEYCNGHAVLRSSGSCTQTRTAASATMARAASHYLRWAARKPSRPWRPSSPPAEPPSSAAR
uniref:Phospholipase/carboxylesterase/thioesterase domain-containing protein n=1 Tax=Alexandrium monilatum TaxID=311494 RepID=A0A7S4WAK1_9DINO